MLVHGLGQTSCHKPRCFIEKKKNIDEAVDSVKKSESTDCTDERANLLSTIRNKVKSGFYNSDSVLEDLGHCFAKVLDQNI
jgi:hypothetical protein